MAVEVAANPIEFGAGSGGARRGGGPQREEEMAVVGRWRSGRRAGEAAQGRRRWLGMGGAGLRPRRRRGKGEEREGTRWVGMDGEIIKEIW